MSEKETQTELKMEEDPKGKRLIGRKSIRKRTKVADAVAASHAAANAAHVGAGEASVAEIEKGKPGSTDADGDVVMAAVPEPQKEEEPSQALSVPII